MSKDPDLFDVIKRLAEVERIDIHTALPARIVSYDGGQTVTVEVMIRQSSETGAIEIPPLIDVPVQFSRAGGFCFTVPIVAGDEGLVIFAERCIDGWWATGEKSDPMDARMHDYSDAFFIPGVSSRKKALPNLFMDGASIQTDDGSTFLRITNGRVLIKGDIEHTGSMKTTGVIIGQDVKTDNGISLKNHNHPDPHGGNTGKPNQ